MKKLLMMATVATMACGAWAAEEGTSYSYTFGLTIYNIPTTYEKLTPAASVYLLDTVNNKIVAYGRISDWDVSGTVSGKRIQLSQDIVSTKTSSDYEMLGADGSTKYTYATAGYTELMSSSIQENLHSPTKDVEFMIQFDTSNADAINALETAKTKYGYGNICENLMAVLSDPSKDAEFYQEFTNVKIVDGSLTKSYTANGTFAAPEPTSGLLVLLGMAGLALRRRKAA